MNIKQELISTNDVEILKFYYKHDDYYIRESVAMNSNCPIYILEELSEDPYYHVLLKVAENINCPVHILKKFYKMFENQEINNVILNHPNWIFNEFQ